MNADELAKGLSQNQIYGDDYGLFNKRIQNMLRHQQAEIESMQERMIVAEKELNHMRSFFGCDPAYYGMTSAEPVWWIEPTTNSVMNNDQYQSNPFANETGDWIPLYTHPANTLEPDCYGDGNVYRGVRSKDSEIQTIYIDSTAKTLTEEEIQDCMGCLPKYNSEIVDEDLVQFARAILRKAQEK